jgi:hypothetical protein
MMFCTTPRSPVITKVVTSLKQISQNISGIVEQKISRIPTNSSLIHIQVEELNYEICLRLVTTLVMTGKRGVVQNIIIL